MPADPITTIAAVVLVTVTGNGLTSKLPFDNDSQCLMARSLTLTGLTPADVKTQRQNVERAREAEQKEKEAANAKWLAAHPLRQPKDDAEQKSVDECLAALKAGKPYFDGSGYYGYRVTAQCVVQDVQPLGLMITPSWSAVYQPDQQFVSYDGPTPQVKALSDVKSAFCIRADGSEVPLPSDL